MKGYRTIIFSAIMTLVGMLGWKISPQTANQWADMFVAAWGIGAILLRQITTTPIGGVVALSAPALSADDIAGLRTDLQTLLGHAGISLQAAQLVANMSGKIDMLASAITAAAQANALPADLPEQPAPAGQVDVPASADDGAALSPSPPVSAQPIAPAAAPAPAPVAEDLPAPGSAIAAALAAAAITPAA
jgi:hypothetical protein